MWWFAALVLTLLGAKTSEGDPLQVGFYYEALCPDSKDAIINQIWPTWTSVPSIVHFDFIPWGKANVSSADGTIHCQHGETECWGNRLHGCVIHNTDDGDARVKALTCLMREQKHLRERAQSCVEDGGLSWKEMHDCSVADISYQEALEYQTATKQLDPPVHFIPTFTLDGSQGSPAEQQNMLDNLLKFVCEKWQQRGGDLPAGCIGV